MPQNEYLIDGDVALVRLTSGEIALIDAKFVQLASRYTWHNIGGYMAAVVPKCLTNKSKRTTLYYHRILFESYGNLKAKLHVDHIAHRRLDNRLCSLRMVDRNENSLNNLTRRVKLSEVDYLVEYALKEGVILEEVIDRNYDTHTIGELISLIFSNANNFYKVGYIDNL